MNHLSKLAAVVAVSIQATASAQSPVQQPFYGVYGPGSPELAANNLRTGDIVKRYPGSTPSTPLTRGLAQNLMFPPTSIAANALEITAIAYANDDFYPWGPAAPLTPGINLRQTTLMYSVGPTTVVKRQNGSNVPICANVPMAAQIFTAVFKAEILSGSTVQTFSYLDATTNGYCGLGSTSGSQSTVLAAMAFEPNNSTNGGIPVFFCLSAANCQTLRSNDPTRYSHANPTDIFWADGMNPPTIVAHGNIADGGPFQEADEVDGLMISAATAFAVTLTPNSPTVLAGTMPLYSPVGGPGGGPRTVYADANTIIGYVPSTATLWMPSLSLPSGYNWNVPFLLIDPSWMGVGAPSTTPGSPPITYDNINSIQDSDPAKLDGIDGSLPLRGAPGMYASSRVHILGNGVAGDGGGVFSIPAVTGSPVRIKVDLNNIISVNGSMSSADIVCWSLMAYPNFASELSTGIFVDPLFGSSSVTAFDMSLAVPLVGNVPGVAYTQGAVNAGSLEWKSPESWSHLEGSFALQILAVVNHPAPSYVVRASNCIQFDVRDQGKNQFNP